MTPRDRIALGFLINPLAAIAGIFLLIPLAIPFLAVFLLIKLLEVLLAKKPADPQRQLAAPKIFFMKEGKW
jgi:hypothetical protein